MTRPFKGTPMYKAIIKRFTGIDKEKVFLYHVRDEAPLENGYGGIGDEKRNISCVGSVFRMFVRARGSALRSVPSRDATCFR